MKKTIDYSGQEFGHLYVIRKGRKDATKSRQLWILECDCGRIIEREIWHIINKRQISCGCARRRGLIDNKRRCKDITGQKFGELTAIKLTGNKDKAKKPTWQLVCSCGNYLEMSLTDLSARSNYRLNCKDKEKHPDRWLRYPTMSSPCPKEVSNLIEKYLKITESKNEKQMNQGEQDEKIDRLIRGCWILVWRRSQGEDISELHERRYILKSLRFCKIDAYRKQKSLSKVHKIDYTKSNDFIGGAMTNETPLDYPLIETKGNSLLPKKRIKFKRY